MIKSPAKRVPSQQRAAPRSPHSNSPPSAHTIGAGGSTRRRLSGSTWEFDDALSALRREYVESGEAVTVNFRELVPVPPGGDRATHLVHAYPAKLLANIPLFFANCS